MEFRQIGIIGAGTMGIGLAIDLTLHQMRCILVDISNEILEKAKEEIINGIRFAPLLNKNYPVLSKEEILDKVTFSISLEDIEGCDFIIENVTEAWSVKEQIYKEIDHICKPAVCFAVNTSAISITQIAELTKRPEKIIGMHFMNPVFLKPVVEVIKGQHTSNETLGIAIDFLKAVQKEAIIINDSPGFVSNRLSHLFINEAALIVQEGIATPEQVDEIFKRCFGHAMGPLETADLIGLDTVVNSIDILYESIQENKFLCCSLLRELVANGDLGKKSGKGFYEYGIWR